MRDIKQLRSATTIEQSSGQFYQGKLGETKPVRYYRLQVKQRSSLDLSLSQLRTDANLALVNQQGKAIGKSTRKGKQQESIAKTINPGTYYVRVYRQKGATHYRLNIDMNPIPSNSATNPAIATVAASSSLSDQVLTLVNNYRSQAGLKPLRLNSLLTTAAQAHSQDMALNDYFSHTGFNGSTADERISATGYNYAAIGENIAAGFATPEGVVAAWMDSPGHRANILHPVLKEMGLGFYFLESDTGSNNYRYYWTQNFGQLIP